MLRCRTYALFAAVVATFKDATAKDDSWLSHLESTNWLQIVIKCLSFSLAVLKKLVDENRTVVLKGKHTNHSANY